MRLIDADALAVEMKARQEAAKKWVGETKDEDDSTYARACGAYSVFSEVKLTLDKMPTVDAVQVVRCKECKHYQSGIDINGKPFTRCNGTTKEGRILRGYGKTEPDWFCKDGERRSE